MATLPPVFTAPLLLPGGAAFNLVNNGEIMDIDGTDWQSMGGLLFSYAFATPLNNSGQTLYYIACPDDIEANQASTGDISFARLVIASFPNNAAANTVTGTFTFTRTKNGANRTGSSSALLGSGPTRNVTWTWSDTTSTPSMVRVKGILADGTRWGTNTFIQVIPPSGNSNYSWNALGNP